MIPVAITQRVDIVSAYNERRDALDQQWSHLLTAAGLLPIPVPNQPATALGVVQRADPVGLILTGGNSLASCGGDAPERDETEGVLIDWFLGRSRPVLGVCRGMQVLQERSGVTLHRVSGHVARSQTVQVHGKPEEVNSFHDWGTRDTSDDLEVWATASDGVVKAIRHRTLPVLGWMWHPERMKPFRQTDIDRLFGLFGG